MAEKLVWCAVLDDYRQYKPYQSPKNCLYKGKDALPYFDTREECQTWCDENQKPKKLHESIRDCLEPLKIIRDSISFKDVIIWFREKDIEYIGMSYLDMYILYIEQN